MSLQAAAVARVLGVQGAGHAIARRRLFVTVAAARLVLPAEQPDDHGKAAKSLLEGHPESAAGGLELHVAVKSHDVFVVSLALCQC